MFQIAFGPLSINFGININESKKIKEFRLCIISLDYPLAMEFRQF